MNPARKIVCATTTAVILASVGAAFGQCIEPDNGFGTATMPPASCAYSTFDDDMFIIDGLPAGTEIAIDAYIDHFVNVSENLGGTLGGTRAQYGAILHLPMQGTGALAGFSRFISMPLPDDGTNLIDTAPRVGGDPVQSFDAEMIALTGEIIGDPDFCTLRVWAGVANGLPPSPGRTVMDDMPGNTWQVDSFFDVTYTIEFVGCPGSILEGMSGTTTGVVRFSTDSCPADLNNDGVVDTADLGILLSEFGTPGVLADLNGDGVVDTADLGILLASFGLNCFPI